MPLKDAINKFNKDHEEKEKNQRNSELNFNVSKTNSIRHLEKCDPQ
jgi:hypothetical protein